MLDKRRWEYVKLIDYDGHSIRNDLYHKPEEPASYIIWKEGDKIYAKNGHTGQIPYEDDDAATVIQAALDALTSGRTWKEKVVLKGNFVISRQIDLPSYLTLVIDGSLKASSDFAGGAGGIMLRAADEKHIDIFGGVLDGNDTVGCAIALDGWNENCTVQGVEVKNIADGGSAAIRAYGEKILVRRNYIHDVGFSGLLGSGAPTDQVIPVDLKDSVITENFIFGVKDYCLVLQHPYNVVVSNNVLKGTGSAKYPQSTGGGLMARYSEYCVYKKNIIYENYYEGINIGIHAYHGETSHHNVIEGNIIFNNNQAGLPGSLRPGIKLDSPYSDSPAEYNSIVNNIVIDDQSTPTQAYGIQVAGLAIRKNIISNNYVTGQGRTGIIVGGSRQQVTGNIVNNNSRESADSYDGIHETSSYTVFADNVCFDDQSSPTQRYGIYSEGTYNLIMNNVFHGNVTGGMYVTSGTVKVKHNMGFITENNGIATIPNGSSSVVVDHGLAATPNVVKLTGTHSEVKDCWVTNVTSTQFTINAPAAVTADRDVYWQAEV